MACSNKNLVRNGEFTQGLSDWSGSKIKRIKNPISQKEFCVLMGDQNTIKNPALLSVLKQDITGPFENGCAYYLTYQLLHFIPLKSDTTLYATVAYLDSKRNILNSTPLYILPSHAANHWSSYTSIVPPFPPRTASLSVSFMLKHGMMCIKNISLGSRTIIKK